VGRPCAKGLAGEPEAQLGPLRRVVLVERPGSDVLELGIGRDLRNSRDHPYPVTCVLHGIGRESGFGEGGDQLQRRRGRRVGGIGVDAKPIDRVGMHAVLVPEGDDLGRGVGHRCRGRVVELRVHLREPDLVDQGEQAVDQVLGELGRLIVGEQRPGVDRDHRPLVDESTVSEQGVGGPASEVHLRRHEATLGTDLDHRCVRVGREPCSIATTAGSNGQGGCGEKHDWAGSHAASMPVSDDRFPPPRSSAAGGREVLVILKRSPGATPDPAIGGERVHHLVPGVDHPRCIEIAVFISRACGGENS
jgi:hypothetical protein